VGLAASQLELNQYLDGVSLQCAACGISADLEIRTINACAGSTKDIINVWTARVLLIRISLYFYQLKLTS
jgi:hypothetical protein